MPRSLKELRARYDSLLEDYWDYRECLKVRRARQAQRCHILLGGNPCRVCQGYIYLRRSKELTEGE